jgi:hypothetical protein
VANIYTLGSNVRVSASFKSNGTLVDPDPLVFWILEPGSTAASYLYAAGGTTPTKSATGIYYMDITASSAGDYHCRFVSGSTNRGAGALSFMVSQNEV